MEGLLSKVRRLMRFRGYRGSRRSNGPRQVVQSFKKVINHAPASFTAGTNVYALTLGTDSTAAGQTGPTDTAVPTGAVIKYIEIQLALANLGTGAGFIHVAIEQLHDGQSIVAPNVVGGNPRRNQVFFQRLYNVGADQSFYATFKLKIPKKYQRVREGDNWQFVWINGATMSASLQAIYKFYR